MMADANIETRLAWSETDLPSWSPRQRLVKFLHTTMKPYEDSPEDIDRGLSYAFSSDRGMGGFVLLARVAGEDHLAGAVVMLRTGMRGYVPDHLLLFISVRPDLRGKGLGSRLIHEAVKRCDGDVKLHVERDNPAKRLYRRFGFTTKYDEMRYVKPKQAEVQPQRLVPRHLQHPSLNDATI